MAASVKAISSKARNTAIRYAGEIATLYEKRRMDKAKWIGEDRKVKTYLSDLSKGAVILDIPCGTGRFFPFYREKGFKVLGVDISPDMISQAEKRAGNTITVEKGSIFSIGLFKEFNVVVCIRFLNLIEPEDVKMALAEMQYASRSRVIFTLRVKQKNPTRHYHRAYPMSLIQESLLPKWNITRNEPIHEKDYRLIQLQKHKGRIVI